MWGEEVGGVIGEGRRRVDEGNGMRGWGWGCWGFHEVTNFLWVKRF